MSENKYYVYEYFIKPTDEIFYVGKGCGDRYKTTKGRNKFFSDMYNSHECGVRIIAKDLSEEEAYRLEYERIQELKATTNFRLTNQTDGGDGTRGFHPSAEHRRKITLAVRRRWENPELRQETSVARRDPNSTYQSQAFREKISLLVQGENNPNYGNHWSDEQKSALSDKFVREKSHAGLRNGRCKAIMCVETKEVFPYIRAAKEKYGVKCEASFSCAINNPKRTAAGLHWVTVNV